jgi:hypothetical protein
MKHRGLIALALAVLPCACGPDAGDIRFQEKLHARGLELLKQHSSRQTDVTVAALIGELGSALCVTSNRPGLDRLDQTSRPEFTAIIPALANYVERHPSGDLSGDSVRFLFISSSEVVRSVEINRNSAYVMTDGFGCYRFGDKVTLDGGAEDQRIGITFHPIVAD